MPITDVAPLGIDLIWEVENIAAEIGRTPRQALYLLERGRLPAAKIGGRWCSSRSGLRKHFAALLDAREVA